MSIIGDPLRNIDKFHQELDHAGLDQVEFIENNYSEIVELLETGSVSIILNNKEITLSLHIKGL